MISSTCISITKHKHCSLAATRKAIDVPAHDLSDRASPFAIKLVAGCPKWIRHAQVSFESAALLAIVNFYPPMISYTLEVTSSVTRMVLEVSMLHFK